MSVTKIEYHHLTIRLSLALAFWQFVAVSSTFLLVLPSAIINRTLPWDVVSLSPHDHHMNHDNPNHIETITSWNHPQQHRSLQTPCIRNQRQLISIIRKTPRSTYTKIEICSQYMAIDARQTKMGANYKGIFFHKKIMDIRCRFSNKCVMDAQGLSRHFYLFNSTITFRGIHFINGNANNEFIGGGSLLVEQNSTLTLIRCDMSHNTANWGGGGGIMVDNSYLLLYGGSTASSPSIFENNTAQGGIYDDCTGNGESGPLTTNSNGGAIRTFGDSRLTRITTVNGYFLFNNNHACYHGGAIYQTSYVLLYTGCERHLNNVVSRDNLEDGKAVQVSYGKSNITNVVFRNNSAGRGGAYASASTEIGFKNVIFEGNSATYGASICQENFGSMLQLDNVTMLNSTELTNSMVYLKDSRADVRMLSVMKSYQGASVYDFLFGSTALVEVFPAVYTTTIKSSGLNVALSPPNRRLTRRDRELLVTYDNVGSWRRRSLQPCVYNAASLRYQVNACDNGKSCIISICARLIRIPYSSITSGIDLSHKKIKIVCRRTKSRCRFDGQGLSRIFYGSNASVTFRGIVFMNGYHSNTGGAIMMNDGSDISAMDCSFVNDTASFGSAVALYDSLLHVAGNRTTFINNQGDTPPIFSYQSALDLSDVIFVQNVAAKYGGGGVLLFNSTFDLFNVTFSNRSINPSDNCDIFNVFDSNNLLNGGYCFNYVQ